MDFIFASLGVLPFVVLLLQTAYCYFKNRQGQLFPAIVSASLVWSLILLAAANALSFFDCLSRTPILALWIIYLGILAYLLILIRQNINFSVKFLPAWIPFALIFFFTFAGAVAYAPNYPDSLAYHLPRIMHWLQNGSMAPYFTSIDRQIGMAPFNAIVIMQSMAIGGNDFFVNLPQWFAFVGCTAGVAHIAGQLGASAKARLLAAFFFCTLPIAIMQSGNSENTLIASFWICAFVSSFMEWMRRPTPKSSFSIGASLGLAILSKGIAYPVACPFVICMAWKCLTRFKTFFLYGAFAASLILLINLPHFYRNYQAAGSVVLSSERNIITTPTPALGVVNAVYNFMLQEPWLVRMAGHGRLAAFATALGVDSQDRTYFPWRGIEEVRDNMVPSDVDGQSPAHAFLILIFLPVFLFRRPPHTGLYLGLAVSAFIVYCLLITWQPWGARLHLPFFMLCAPLMGIKISMLAWKKLRQVILAILGISSFMPLFFCIEHPLGPVAVIAGYRDDLAHFLVSGRDEQYFNLWRRHRRPVLAALDFLAGKKTRSLGLDLGNDGQEYPVWAVLRKKLGREMPVIAHVPYPYPADGNGPDFIFRQRHAAFVPMEKPQVFMREGKDYKLVFPAAD